MNNLFDVEGKVVLITGGAGVLGGNMAQVLASRGAIVGIMGLRPEEAENAVQNIKNNGGKAFSVVANVLNKESLEVVRDYILKEFGHLDILINAAGGN